MAGRTSAASSRPIIDIVCDVCRAEGFSVVKSSDAMTNQDLTVDIVASRNAGSKTQSLGFECWEGDYQVNGKQVENFVRRVNSLGLEGGVYVSSKGFTGDAEFVARKLGVELWDIPKLKEHLERIKPDDTARIPYTLPVSRTVSSKIFSNKLENVKALRMSSLPRLEFRPYIFARFKVSVGKKQALGIIVLDGVDGRACDGKVLEGELDALLSTGFFIDCLDLKPLTGWMPQLPQELEMKETVTVAALGVEPENIAAKISETLQIETQLSQDSFTVQEASLLHVPILTVELTVAGKVYRKIVQAATGRIIWDDTAKCSYCEHPSKALCETCGGTVCHEHERRCGSCGKHVCSECSTSKGFRNKTLLCPSCRKA